jgi:hypothetical protein
MDKLPIYRFYVPEDDDEIGVSAIAMVDFPAIELNWQTFNDSRLTFKADTEKRIISGPLMVADLPIYRRDETGEYYGVFTAEDIYNIVKKFFRNNNTSQVNMMHDSELMVKDVYMIESFIIDKNRGVYSPAGYNLTEGSWFGSFKVDNDDVWENYIKSGDFKGFSVEGLFKTIKMTDKPKSVIDEIIDVVKNVDASKVEAAMQILKKANI